MSTPGWRTSLIVQGLDPWSDQATPVVTGLMETAAGELQFVLRVGEQGPAVVLPVQAAHQLMVNVRETLTERLKITGDKLGGDDL